MANSSCGIPENGVILNQLHIVEYLDPEDDEVYKVDVSCGGDDSELSTEKYFELIGWAWMMTVAPLLADMVRQYLDESGE